jgi:hypothetical protein
LSIIIPFILVLGATPAWADHEDGSIILPVAHPAIPRLLYSRGMRSNVVGYVFEVRASSKGKTYTLTRTSGFGNLDVYFYGDDDGEIGESCNLPDMDDDDVNAGSESGPICPGDVIPGWGIIVLRTGFDAGFEFHYE